MNRVLCYGDSNTWGYDPATNKRFGPEVRWTGVLQRVLGDGFVVIEEGLNGRTTNLDDSIELGRNGLTYLLPCLESHRPLDAVVIMLGTNDLKQRFDRNASDIAQSAGLLVDLARRFGRRADDTPPAVLMIAPPPTVTLSDLDLMFAGAAEKSQAFGRYYRIIAGWYPGCAFLDAGEVIRSSELDGIHFEAEEHAKLGRAVANEVRRLLG